MTFAELEEKLAEIVQAEPHVFAKFRVSAVLLGERTPFNLLANVRIEGRTPRSGDQEYVVGVSSVLATDAVQVVGARINEAITVLQCLLAAEKTHLIPLEAPREIVIVREEIKDQRPAEERE